MSAGSPKWEAFAGRFLLKRLGGTTENKDHSWKARSVLLCVCFVGFYCKIPVASFDSLKVRETPKNHSTAARKINLTGAADG